MKFKGLIDRFERTGDPIRRHMAALMTSFLAGLFVAAGKFEEIKDNLDLERWFRLPKSHERRIHGRRHAGVRIVQEGPTLVLALDAHAAHPGPFTAEDLLPYRTAREPASQCEALHRRRVMRKARSKKKRPILLAELERRYREAKGWLAQCRVVAFFLARRLYSSLKAVFLRPRFLTPSRGGRRRRPPREGVSPVLLRIDLMAFGSVPPGGGVVSRGFRLAASEPARPLGSTQTSIRDGSFNHSHDDSSSFDARSRMGERALLTRGPLAGCPTNDPGRSPSPASP